MARKGNVKMKKKTSAPRLYLRKGNGWHEVRNVVDIRSQEGKFVLEDGTFLNGDMITIWVKFSKDCAGQLALRKLTDLEPKIIDARVIGPSNFEMSFTVVGDGHDKDQPDMYAIQGRLMGMRRIEIH
jgi:hypothetical protein